jgi:hypothetical protein
VRSALHELLWRGDVAADDAQRRGVVSLDLRLRQGAARLDCVITPAEL